MQEMTKRVANMKDSSPEAKVKVSGCESLHKLEKTSEKLSSMHASVPYDQVSGSEPATNAIN